MVEELNNENFEEKVLKSKEFYLVDFWADWCFPCKMLSPIVDEVAEEQKDKIKVGKVHIPDNEELAQKYGIESIPTLLMFKDGEIKGRIGGFREKDALTDVINNILKDNE
jgi:thioredoxin 1